MQTDGRAEAVVGFRHFCEPWTLLCNSRVCNIHRGRAVPGRFTETLGCSRVAGEYVRNSVLFTLSFAVFIVSGRVNGWRPWLPAGRVIWHYSDTSLADAVALCPPYLWWLQQRGMPVELNCLMSTYILFDIDSDIQSCGSFFAWIRTCVWHQILVEHIFLKYAPIFIGLLTHYATCTALSCTTSWVSLFVNALLQTASSKS